MPVKRSYLGVAAVLLQLVISISTNMLPRIKLAVARFGKVVESKLVPRVETRLELMEVGWGGETAVWGRIHTRHWIWGVAAGEALEKNFHFHKK